MAAQDRAAPARVVTVADLTELREHIRAIVPGGRNPEPSYMSKADALRIIDRVMRAIISPV